MTLKLYFVGDWATKKLHLIRKRSSNGEIHLILNESRFHENGLDSEYLDEIEIRKIMKKEASKPLLIMREE